MRSHFCVALLFALASAKAAEASPCDGARRVEGATGLAAAFQADRVSVRLDLKNGKAPLCLYTDSGGGLVLSAAALQRMGARPAPVTDPAIVSELGPRARELPVAGFNGAVRGPGVEGDGFFVIVPEVREFKQFPDQGDGILGQTWFAGREWTWDYPAGRLALHPVGWAPKRGTPWPVSFKKGEDGGRETNFPRFEISVDGRRISMLFDTGAETLLTEKALADMKDGGPRFRATSMIAASIFKDWHARHPQWRLIEDGQVGTHARMIEVPDVEIAGHHIANVWFTERPDANFRQYMSAMTDAPVDGSLGGNALRGLKVTIDYPNARAWVE